MSNKITPPGGGRKVLVAISGGADSVYLARKLAEIIDPSQLVLAHFEHDLQRNGVEAVTIAQQVASELGCAFFTEKWSNPQRSEAAARSARYDFLRRTATQCGAQWIATGHHADDQTETVLLNFLRGCGTRGLAGMREYDEQQQLWRPLLTTSRSEIEQVCAVRGWRFYTDPSNTDPSYQRNWLRLELLPQITARYPKFSERLRGATDDWHDRAGADIKRANAWLATNSDTGGINRTAFLALDAAAQYSVLQILFAPRSLSRQQVATVRVFIATAKTGKDHEVCNSILRVFGTVFTVSK